MLATKGDRGGGFTTGAAELAEGLPDRNGDLVKIPERAWALLIAALTG